MEQLETMEIKINLLEAASKLAHETVCAKFEDDDSLFDEWYEHYYDLLINLKID